MPALALDTNMLFLFIVGSINRDLLGAIKRLKDFRSDDYAAIEAYVATFSTFVLLPNVVTETSNFIGQLSGKRQEDCRMFLATLIDCSIERYVPSSVATKQAEYRYLGLTDAAILCVLDDGTYLLTSDSRLYVAAMARTGNAQYFDNLRA